MSAFRNFIITFLVALVIFGLLGFGVVKFASSTFFSGGNDVDPDNTGEETVDPDDPSEKEHDITGIKGDSFTALFVMSDYQPDVYDDYKPKGETDEYGFQKEARTIKTPVIVLERVDKETGECVFCGIPANTQITLDGLPCLLEDMYAKKGIDALCEKVMALTGLPVDYYALIEPKQLKSMIDDLGGMTCYVNSVVDYNIEENGTSIHIGRGAQKIDGNKAVALLLCNNYSDTYTTQRKNATGFIHEFLKTFISAAQSDKENAAVNFYKFSKYIKTNFEVEDFQSEMDLIFAFSKMSVSEYTYPGSQFGTGKDVRFSANVSVAADYFLKFKFKG